MQEIMSYVNTTLTIRILKRSQAVVDMIGSNGIALIEGKNVITDDCQISQAFNKRYINIVEKSCGRKPNEIGTTLGSSNDSDIIDRIIKSYQNLAGVLKIKSKFGSNLN